MAKTEEIFLNIEGMHCASCSAKIEKTLNQTEGIESARVNLAMNNATVEYQPNTQNPEKIISKIKELGYGAKTGSVDVLRLNQKEYAKAKRNFLLALLITIPLMVVAMLPMFTNGSLVSPFVDGIAQALLAAVVLFYSGWSIMSDAWNQTKHLSANMNSLIAMGTLTAFIWSLYLLVNYSGSGSLMLYFDSAGMIVTLILLGRFLEAKSKGKAGDAIRALMELAPPKALALINEVEIEVESGAIKNDMILIVRPGEKIPADGIVIDGKPVIDESLLTGESLPVEKKEESEVFGGSLNGNVPFKMRVTASGDKTFLAGIIKLVSEAQSKKAPVQKLADKIAGIFVPIVISIAAVTFILWYIFDPNSPMLIKSVISVLIIACPCSLGLATPTAILVATGRAAREGVIIRGGDILEKISLINMVVFDKTGTLTHGQLEVAEIKTFGQISERNLVRLAASAELMSEHPVARAIIKYMREHQIESTVVKNSESFPGFGLKAICDGRQVIIGNKTMMLKEKVGFGQAGLIGEQEMSKGRTVVYIAMDNQIVGLIALSDKIRSESTAVITELKKMGKEITMLSGDTRKSAGGVARTLGIENFEAEIRPEQKKYMVESLHKAGYKTAMVGDGINDAPALAMADVGVAIGSGTDIAMESSDVVLVRSDLNQIPFMFIISQRAMKIIRQNLFWAFFYNIIAIPIAAGLFYPLFGWTLSPIIAALAMSLSSVFVVSNSLRLNN